MMRLIYLSPSSQEDNVYAAGNTTEAAQCRKIARAAHKALERCGFRSVCADYGTMYTRVAESNQLKADLHVAIHTNAFNRKVSGTRILCFDLAGAGYQAAKGVYDVLAPLTPGTSENISAHPEIYEIKATKCPCVYIEVDFHDVQEVAQWLIDNTQKIGEAICQGICKYWGVTYRAPGEAPVQEGYTREQFIRDVQAAFGAAVDGVAGPQTLSKTVTVSRYRNDTHPVVRAIQKRLAALGYTVVGEADGEAGKLFDTAVKQFQANSGCWVDGELTAGCRTWKCLLEV